MGTAGLIMGALGTLMQTGGQLDQAEAAKWSGQQAQVAKNFEAQQMVQNAGQTRAAAQRGAMEEERRARLIASRALAVGGASGAGLSDPTFAGIMADLAGEGAYRAAVKTYEGEDRARKLEMGAEVARLEGEVARQGGEYRAKGLRYGALGTLASGASSLYAKYGMGGPKADSGSLSSGASWYDAGSPAFNPVT